MHSRRIRLTALATLAMTTIAQATPIAILEPTAVRTVGPVAIEQEAVGRGAIGPRAISAQVSLGCQPSAGFVARVLAQAGARSASRFALGNGFVAVYSDGSWMHIAEFEEPCIVASGSRADMITYFEAE
jgi:hypothetical protein